MAARRHHSILGRSSVEAALRHLGRQRYGKLVEFIEHAIRWPEGQAGAVLAPLTEATEVLRDWTPSERARAVWKMIEEGVVHPQVGPTPQSRRRHALQAAFRLPDAYIGDDWGSSLTERFKQLKAVPGAFGDATSTQPMEMAWKRGVERLAEHLEREFKELRTPEDWARHRPVQADDQGFDSITSSLVSTIIPAAFETPSDVDENASFVTGFGLLSPTHPYVPPAVCVGTFVLNGTWRKPGILPRMVAGRSSSMNSFEMF